MPNYTATSASVFLQKYRIFSKTDSFLDVSTAVRAVTTTPVWSTGHFACCIAAACVLLAAYVFRTAQQKKSDFPFYEAAKTKWIFDAETLVRHSYNKVCFLPVDTVPQTLASVRKLTLLLLSSMIEPIRLEPRKGCKSLSRQSSLAS